MAESRGTWDQLGRVRHEHNSSPYARHGDVTATLDELREQRAHDCRLTPDRALETLEEAEAFLRDRGMLTRTEDSALPSLFGACHEESYRAGRGGFATWPRTKYPWFWELAHRDGIHELSIHRGKSILLTDEAAAIADPICRAELDRYAAEDRDAAILLRHLGDAGPSELEDLKLELGWSAAQLRRARAPLERIGAVVSHGVTMPARGHGHLHTSVLARWDHAFPVPSGRGGLDELIAAAVRAAVLAPEPELKRWFSWQWLWDDGLVERLVDGGRLRRPAPGWVASP
jgi:hypothetical protein